MRPLFLAALFASAAPALAQTTVFVAPVESAQVQKSERVLGNLRARSQSAVAALEEGVLLKLTVRAGDSIAKAQLIAKVDTRRIEAEKTRLKADIVTAQAQVLEHQLSLDNARLDAAALAKAYESGAATDRDLRNANTLVQVSEARLDGAKKAIEAIRAQITLLDIRIADGEVFAPFDGIVTARHAEVGQWIRPGDPLVHLVSSGPLEAWLNLPERFIGQMPAAQNLDIRLESSGQTIAGTDPRPIPMVDESVRTFPWILNIPGQTESGAILKAGMSISANVPFGKPAQHLLVPKNAIVRRGDSALLVKVGAENLAEHVPVKVLFDAQGKFAVQPLTPDSLKTGDQVVIEGNERLFPGTPLVPTERKEKAQ